MAGSDTELRVPLGIPVQTNASEAAASVDELRDALSASKDKIREARDALKSLRGSSDEVKGAKDQLKAILDKENEAISKATLELVKQGTSYEKLTAQAKAAQQVQEKATAAQEKAAMQSAASQAKAAKAAEDKAKAEADATAKARKATTEAHDNAYAFNEYKNSASALAGGLAAVAAAAVAVTAALVAGAVALAKWVITTASAERSLNLVREAAMGSAEQARALGTQVDALAGKVGTSKEALNGLAVSLRNGGLGGEQLVDTFNAVGQAAAAMGDQAGATLRGLVERSRVTQRMFVNPLELRGTGISFDELATELAGSMKVGVDKAKAALWEGRVPLGEGAKALRATVEKKFGDVNIRKMLSLEGIAETIGKKLSLMTKGIDLDRANKPLATLLGLLDEGTFTGHTMKRAVTAIGNGLVTAFEKSAPMIEKFTKGLVIGALQVYVAYLKVKRALSGAFGDSKLLENVDLVKTGVTVAKGAILGLAAAAALVGAAVVVGFAPFVWVGKQLATVAEGVVDLVNLIEDIDWPGTARAMIDGLVNGLKAGKDRVVKAVSELAQGVKDTFTGKMLIKSPSKVFERYGDNIDEGLAGGVERGGRAQEAVDGMVAVPAARSGGGAAGSAGGAPGATINATLVIQGGSGGPASAALELAELREAFTKLVQEAAAAAGIVVPV